MDDNLLFRLKDQAEGGSIIIYSEAKREFYDFIGDMNKLNIEIIVESLEENLLSLDKSVSYFTGEKLPNLILIDTPFIHKGLQLYKYIKDLTGIWVVPVLFIIDKNCKFKLESLKMGALDYIERPYDKEELILKAKNNLNIGEKYINNCIYDSLTGSYSKIFGEELVKNTLQLAKSIKKEFTMLIIDMDNMNSINSAVGRIKGNEIIRDIINVFKEKITLKGFIYRYRGDQFIIVFYNENPSRLLEISEYVQQETFKLSVHYGITISFTGGIAAINGDVHSCEKLRNLAFESLEDGKRDGKARTYIHKSVMESGEKINILIFGEDKSMIDILSSRYKNKGYIIYNETNIDNTLKLFENNLLDLIIIDFTVSSTAGLENLKLVNKIKPKIKIIVLCPQNSISFIDVAIKYGAEDYLVKPFSPFELDLKIHKALK